jgi:hypothetical protein
MWDKNFRLQYMTSSPLFRGINGAASCVKFIRFIKFLDTLQYHAEVLETGQYNVYIL